MDILLVIKKTRQPKGRRRIRLYYLLLSGVFILNDATHAAPCTCHHSIPGIKRSSGDYYELGHTTYFVIIPFNHILKGTPTPQQKILLFCFNPQI